tara:strand:- start:187 stop:480 length:294 start_codon:yes stop_codon:yes gene_type:complete
MNIARVIDGVVVNLEVADAEWIDANTPSPDGAIFTPIPDGNPGHIGLGWSETDGFEQPPTPPPSVPGPGEKWDFGDIPEDQSYDELEAALLDAFNGN